MKYISNKLLIDSPTFTLKILNPYILSLGIISILRNPNSIAYLFFSFFNLNQHHLPISSLQQLKSIVHSFEYVLCHATPIKCKIF